MLSRQDLRDKQELLQILLSIQDFHGCAYGWKPEVTADSIYAATEAGGCLLRTKIRAAIEFFDQLHQYGEAGKTKITELGKEPFDEEDTPELPGLECLIISSKQNKYSLKNTVFDAFLGRTYLYRSLSEFVFQEVTIPA